ncbi:Protein KIN-4 b [Aphelenchoides avenae]|nr:Protein KIN-4 b [Aphelenchus avenae]
MAPSTSQAAVPKPGVAKPPIVIRKGPQGYGFTIRSVRVYLSESSEYYTIEHMVAAVREGSPAYEAGLRENDLITHIHTQSVHNMTHPQLMHRLLSCGNEITLHVTPLDKTTIKEGEARRSVGKLLRKKPKKPQRRMPMEKKQRKSSALLRRLSGKRGTGDIVPGTSCQKQTFMPRSVSSQDGVSTIQTGGTSVKSQLLLSAESAATARVTVPTTTSGTASSAAVTMRSKITVAGGAETSSKVPAQKHKRLSDFGLTSTSPIPEVPQTRSGRTSPLVLSSKTSAAAKGPIAQRAVDPEAAPPLPPHRRPSLLQGLLHPNSQSGHSSTSAGTGRKNSGGPTQIPVSPLARQSSSSSTSAAAAAAAALKPVKQPSTEVPEAPKVSKKSPPRPPPPKLSPQHAQLDTAPQQQQSISARSPSPVRKISPSRLVQRLFRVASRDTTAGSSSSSTSQNPPSSS